MSVVKATEMGWFLGITIKRMAPSRCLDGYVKEPYGMSMACEPDCRSNFFLGQPVHLCAVTCIIERSFIRTLSNRSTRLDHCAKVADINTSFVYTQMIRYQLPK